jgi:SAM-dependent methyltransferase
VKPWFETYFETEYFREYATGHKTDKQNDTEAAFVAARLAHLPCGRVLDLGCGYGRHSVRLAERGFRVVGFDLSPSLLANLQDAAVAASTEVTTHHGDMRRMTFSNEFDAVIMMFTTFGIFDDADNHLVLEGVARALKPGGSCLIDLDNPILVLRRFQTEDWRTQGDGEVILNTRRYDVVRGCIDGQRIHMKSGEASREYSLHIRLYTCPEIVKLLDSVGLSLLRSFGSYDSEPYSFESPRMILLAQKRLQ